MFIENISAPELTFREGAAEAASVDSEGHKDF